MKHECSICGTELIKDDDGYYCPKCEHRPEICDGCGQPEDEGNCHWCKKD